MKKSFDLFTQKYWYIASRDIDDYFNLSYF